MILCFPSQSGMSLIDMRAQAALEMQTWCARSTTHAFS